MGFLKRFYAGHVIIQMLEEAHKMLAEEKAQPSQLKFRILFMSTRNVINETSTSEVYAVYTFRNHVGFK